MHLGCFNLLKGLHDKQNKQKFYTQCKLKLFKINSMLALSSTIYTKTQKTLSSIKKSYLCIQAFVMFIVFELSVRQIIQHHR